MKQLIKQLLRESLISEKLTDVDTDVDILYQKYFKILVDAANSGEELIPSLFNQYTIDTSRLISPEAVKANKLNPCEIIINGSYGNAYQPKTNSIHIGYGGLYKSFVSNYLPATLDSMAESSGSYNSFKKEFTEVKIKGSIHHELAHWIDDTFNNKHIRKRTDRDEERGAKKFSWEDRYLSNFEMQAIIHNVHQLKKQTSDESWNNMSFDDLIISLPSLMNIRDKFSRNGYNTFKKLLLSRMNREGMLGNNMKNTY